MKLKYHTYYSHIGPMLKFIDEHMHLNGINGESKRRVLKLAAIFHDIVYVPGSETNEDESIAVFDLWCNMKYADEWSWIKATNKFVFSVESDFLEYAFKSATPEEKLKVVELIENTKNPFDMRYGDELGHYFAKLDVYGLTQDFNTLMINEHRIYNEFKDVYTLEQYKKGRVEFLTRVINELPNCNVNGIEQLIKYVNERDYGTLGIFAGSFNPFTIGHANVLDQAMKNFDKVIVVRMRNYEKPEPKYDIPTSLKCHVMESDKLLSELVLDLSTGYSHTSVIRALRNGDDLQYEQNLRAVVNDFDDVSFVYYMTDPKYQHISSSMVRSLPTDELRAKYIIS